MDRRKLVAPRPHPTPLDGRSPHAGMLAGMVQGTNYQSKHSLSKWIQWQKGRRGRPGLSLILSNFMNWRMSCQAAIWAAGGGGGGPAAEWTAQGPIPNDDARLENDGPLSCGGSLWLSTRRRITPAQSVTQSHFKCAKAQAPFSCPHPGREYSLTCSNNARAIETRRAALLVCPHETFAHWTVVIKT